MMEAIMNNLVPYSSFPHFHPTPPTGHQTLSLSIFLSRFQARRKFSFLRLPLLFLLRGEPERHTPLAWHRSLSCGIPVT